MTWCAKMVYNRWECTNYIGLTWKFDWRQPGLKESKHFGGCPYFGKNSAMMNVRSASKCHVLTRHWSLWWVHTWMMRWLILAHCKKLHCLFELLLFPYCPPIAKLFARVSCCFAVSLLCHHCFYKVIPPIGAATRTLCLYYHKCQLRIWATLYGPWLSIGTGYPTD